VSPRVNACRVYMRREMTITQCTMKQETISQATSSQCCEHQSEPLLNNGVAQNGLASDRADRPIKIMQIGGVDTPSIPKRCETSTQIGLNGQPNFRPAEHM
jgi:hypothetical protein